METALPPDREPTPEPAPAPPPVAPSISAAITPQLPEVPASDVPTYRDRSTGLTIFGVVQIILGLLAALMVPLIAMGALMARLAPGGAMRPGQIISGVATYAFASAVFLTLGIGSARMKRWARALTLVTSWYWLIVGALATVLLTAVLPVIMKGVLAQMKQSGADASSAEVSTGVMAVILTLIIIFAAFFLVLVPIAFVIFYSRKDVAETCRHRDPVERWTDRTPLPVLGASVALFTGSLYMLLVGLTTPLFPFFGSYLTGIAAVACFVVLAALDLYISVALFRLQLSGWWIAIGSVSVRMVSMILTYGRADLMQAYSKMGMSDAQLEMLNSSPLLRGHVLLWWSMLSMVLFLGYLVWLKRYFKPAAAKIEELTAPTV